MTRVLEYLRHHAIAISALVLSILALGSASYAAFTIDGRDIKNHSIDPVKFDSRFINGSVRAWARVGPDGHVIAGSGGPSASEQINGVYIIRWKAVVGGRCATAATIDANSSQPTEAINTPQLNAHFVAGYASAATSAFHRKVRRTLVETFNQAGQPTPLGFDVLVVC